MLITASPTCVANAAHYGVPSTQKYKLALKVDEAVVYPPCLIVSGREEREREREREMVHLKVRVLQTKAPVNRENRSADLLSYYYY